jgi:DNA-binding HxlR family transcriptional regulator
MAPKQARRNSKKTVGCPVETTLAVLGGQWKPMVLHFLMDGTMRFGELQRALHGISARTLTKQLRELEGDGIIHREVHKQVPLKVDYWLTPTGKSLKPVLMAMHRWGEKFAASRARSDA